METLSRCNEKFTLIKERVVWHTGPFMNLLMSFLASEGTSTGMCTHINRPERCHSSALVSPSLFSRQRCVFQSAEAPNLIISMCLTDIRCTRTTIRFLGFCFQVLEVKKYCRPMWQKCQAKNLDHPQFMRLENRTRGCKFIWPQSAIFTSCLFTGRLGRTPPAWGHK